MDECIASSEELDAFSRSTPAERRTSPALKGLLAEIATSGVIRYDWKQLQTLVAFYLDKVLLDYEAEGVVEVGPRRPLPGGETPAMLRHRLQTQLADLFPTDAPFTIQRLAELLLEPHKHYSRLDKLAFALEKLIAVTSTVAVTEQPPPRPRLKDLPPVNCSPRNPPTGAGDMRRHSAPLAPENGTSEGGPVHASAAGDPAFGLTSAVVASSSRDPHHNRQGTPELEEALGHLNEAGVAARAAPHSPLRETAATAHLSPPRVELTNGLPDNESGPIP